MITLYARTVEYSTGRKFAPQTGLEVHLHKDEKTGKENLRLWPTGKKLKGGPYIEIPVENLPTVIELMNTKTLLTPDVSVGGT